jgi:rRNA maturation endonuclease Nob1
MSNEHDRQIQAKKIISQPSDYKVCEGCGSIVTSRTHSCPSCHGYRFDGEITRVVSQARSLGSRRSRSVVSTDLA